MRTRLLPITAFLLLALTLPAGAAPYGQRPGYDPDRAARGEGQHRPLLQLLRTELDLTPAQARQIRSLVSERRDEAASIRERCRSGRNELRQLVRDRAGDDAELRRKAYRLADQRLDLLTMRQDIRDRIIALLTPQQRDRWEQLRDRLTGAGQHRGWGARRNL